MNRSRVNERRERQRRSVTTVHVALRAVLTTNQDHRGNGKQNHDDRDDCEYLYPTWHARR
jgi:hypothetical protein